MASILTTILPGPIGALAGAVIGFFLEPMRAHVFGPRLEVRFNPSDGKHVADSLTLVEAQGRSPQEVQSRWVRVSVENTGRSHLIDGEPFLVAVHREQEGRWAETSFIDPLRLPWSSTDPETAWRVRDLPREVQFFVDVCRSVQGAWESADTFDIVTFLGGRPIRLQHLFSEHGRYRLTIVVTGKGIRPAKRCVFVTWAGTWDKLEATGT